MAENLTDRQAAEAVRDTLSWKYALGLGLDDEEFDSPILSEFRAGVLASQSFPSPSGRKKPGAFELPSTRRTRVSEGGLRAP